MHGQLRDYLRKGLQKGYSDEMLIQSLRRTGYHEAFVRDQLTEVKMELTTPEKHPVTLFLEILFALMFLLTITLMMIFAFVPLLTKA